MSEGSSKTFCVIEDNEPIRKLFTLLLRKAGHTVHDFALGETAMEWLAENETPIVLCDIMLPDTSGEDVLEFIRNLPSGNSVKVIALTAFARQGDREKFLEMGFDGYIAKPINPQSFVEDIFLSVN